MGQYFDAINLDKRQSICPIDYGSGLKLMEHAWLQNGFVNAVVHCLSPDGPWHQTRLVWAGDYMDPGLFLEEFENLSPESTLYSVAESRQGGFTRIKPTVGDGPTLRYIINHSLDEYVDLNSLPANANGWIIHPLPLLTCSGNDFNRGDVRGENNYLESWTGHILSASYELPIGLIEICPDFLK